MNNKEKNIEHILDSLNGIQRATPGDFFYTRVSARLLSPRTTIWESISKHLSRPVVVVSGLCLIVIINMLAVINQSSYVSPSNDSTELSLVEEYTLASANLYDYENSEVK